MDKGIMIIKGDQCAFNEALSRLRKRRVLNSGRCMEGGSVIYWALVRFNGVREEQNASSEG